MASICILVMPAYNEEGCIEKVVRAWHAELKRHFAGGFRLVVINDGSRDRTGALLDGLRSALPELDVVHQKNQGHGAALRHGYERALSLGGEYIFHVDSDDQFLPADFGAIWAKSRDFDLVIGRRRHRRDALHRLVITRILRVLLWIVFGQNIPDSNSPYRLFRANFLKQMLMLLPEDLFAPNIFLALLGSAAHRACFTVPVTHEERRTGKVSIVRWKLIKVCLRCVRQLVQFRFGFEPLVVSLQHEWSPPRPVQGVTEVAAEAMGEEAKRGR